MKSCPHCGDTQNGFVVHGQMAGPAESYYDADGNYIELNMDKTYWKSDPRVIRCGKCHKIRHDVYLTDERIIEEK